MDRITEQAALNSARTDVHSFLHERAKKDADDLRRFRYQAGFLPGVPGYEEQQRRRQTEHDGLSAKVRGANHALELLNSGAPLDVAAIKTIEEKLQETRDEIESLNKQATFNRSSGWARQIQGKPAEAKVINTGRQLEAELAKDLGYPAKLSDLDYLPDSNPEKFRITDFLAKRNIGSDQARRLGNLLRYHELLDTISHENTKLERVTRNFSTIVQQKGTTGNQDNLGKHEQEARRRGSPALFDRVQQIKKEDRARDSNP